MNYFDITRRVSIVIIIFVLTSFSLKAQLNLANCKSEVNFREGSGMNYEVVHTINQSNRLVILPGESINGFVEVFDVETGSLGYVFKLILVL